MKLFLGKNNQVAMYAKCEMIAPNFKVVDYDLTESEERLFNDGQQANYVDGKLVFIDNTDYQTKVKKAKKELQKKKDPTLSDVLDFINKL